MKIMHYSLGLPPYRTGGLTKYSLDLMLAQVDVSDEVYLIFPGKFTLNKNIKFVDSGKYNGINIFEMVNPQLVSLLGGVKNPSEFMKKKDRSIIRNFLMQLKPDIIHIHTLMGLPKELVEISNELNIKIVFTTHDYYGICPMVNLIDYNGNICDDFEQGKKCSKCNSSAISKELIFLMQSHTYKQLKNSVVVKKLRAMKKNSIMVEKENNVNTNIDKDISNSDKYVDLRNYYIDIFKHIDFFHFNSKTTKEVYSKYGIYNGKVISITHKDIKDFRKEKLKESKQVKFFYLGNLEKHKGIDLILEAFHKLQAEGWSEWELNIYGNTFEMLVDESISDKVKFNGRYNYKDLQKIMDNNDILILPSIWYETFGFTILEAISYGVPVIITNLVGAKDIINEEIGDIIDPNISDLKEAMKKYILTPTLVSDKNRNILNIDFKYDMKNHEKDIRKVYIELTSFK